MTICFSTAAGELQASDAERGALGFALRFCTEECSRNCFGEFFQRPR